MPAKKRIVTRRAKVSAPKRRPEPSALRASARRLVEGKKAARGAKRIVQQRTIQALPEVIFRMVTQGGEFREWLCDEARADVRPGGRCEFRWRSGYEARGVFEAVEPSKRVAFTWRGTDEPGETSVEFTLAPANGGTAITMTQTGFGTGAKWSKVFAEAEKGWADGLENLQSIIETGIDLREARRPMMGVYTEPLDAARAVKEGIAAEAGIYLSGVMEGMGAQAAGLKQGDVIVALGGREVRDFDTLVTALRTYRAGDRVDVAYVRGQDRLSATIELRGRPIPEIADDPAAVVAAAREKQEQARQRLAEATAGVTEEEAGRAPKPDEWSVKQVLAHLSVTERDIQGWMGLVVMGEEPSGGGNPSILPEKLAAALSGAPTVSALLARVTQDQEETLAMFAALTPEHRAHKARYRRMAQTLLEMPDHTQEHAKQIQANVQAIRGG
jgi:uncharacterized protein YndB with AHSA1/START domain